MGALDGLSRKALIEEQKRLHDANAKELAKLDVIMEGYKKAGVQVPELERIRRSLKAAHDAVAELFADDEPKQLTKK